MKIILGVLAVALTLNVCAASDKDIVAMTILAEARGEGEEGMYAVAAVIAQRALNRQLSPRKVCLQNGLNKRGVRVWQFSCWNSGKGLRHLLQVPQAKYALRLAECLTNNIKGIDRSYVGYADHYHNNKVKPSWSNINKKTKIINNHIFYKLR